MSSSCSSLMCQYRIKTTHTLTTLIRIWKNKMWKYGILFFFPGGFICFFFSSCHTELHTSVCVCVWRLHVFCNLFFWSVSRPFLSFVKVKPNLLYNSSCTVCIPDPSNRPNRRVDPYITRKSTDRQRSAAFFFFNFHSELTNNKHRHYSTHPHKKNSQPSREFCTKMYILTLKKRTSYCTEIFTPNMYTFCTKIVQVHGVRLCLFVSITVIIVPFSLILKSYIPNKGIP